MSAYGPTALQTLRQIVLCLLSSLLLLSLVPLGTCPLQQAQASGSTAYLEKAGNIDYATGSWNTHIFMADDGTRPTIAYCVEPSKNSPSEGDYDKQAFRAPSGRNAELKADLWFAYGGPGFDTSMWPRYNWDGDPMTAEDYYLCSHILLADTYSSNGYAATYGAEDYFCDWIVWNILGFDIDTGSVINRGAVGRVAKARRGEVSEDYETFLLAGGDSQTIAACGYFNPYGTIKMQKRSKNPIITDNNPCYSFENITYGIYKDEGCTEDTGVTLTLDQNGYAQSGDLWFGTYYVREIESSLYGSGYAYDPTVYPCKVRGGKATWLHDTSNGAGDAEGNDVSDMPITKDIKVLVQKHDMLTKSPVPSGSELMQNAYFKLEYYDNLYGDVGGQAKRTWTLKTDGNGQIDLGALSAESFVSGDTYYTMPDSDEVVLPLGTYRLTELAPPVSYEIPEYLNPVIFTLSSSGTSLHDVDSGGILRDGGIIIDERPIRHDLRFVKRDLDTQRPMEKIPFLVSRLDEKGSLIERHVVVTDANGMFNSSTQYADHTTRTNANDSAVRIVGGEYVVDETKLDPDAGVWFGAALDGSWIAPDNEYGAVPDGTKNTYLFEELPVAANAGKALVKFEAVAHAAHPMTIDLGTVGNTSPTLATTALDDADKDKLVSRDMGACVLDTVVYSGLVAGRSYRIEGRLVNAETGATIIDATGHEVTSTSTFKAEASSGTAEISFSFDASSIPDQTRLVVCETLYEGNRELAKHEALDDAAQTVVIVQPTLQTSAINDRTASSILIGDVDAIICDRVTYTGLTPGEVYELKGVVMDKKTGEPFLSVGNEVRESVEFTPDASSGYIDVYFTFDAAELGQNTELVVFEELYHHDVLISSHEDIDDAGQTVSVFPPALKTYAHDPLDGDSTVSADTKTEIVDTVEFEGLVPGEEYELRASLINKETGKPMLDPFDRPIEASHTFAPIEPNGNTDVTVAFDAANIEVSAVAVVFEELYREGRHLGSHIDLEDTDQTVIINQPNIRTFASVDGKSKQVMRDEGVSITDTVSYFDLKKGYEYKVEGVLMNKENGLPVVNKDGSPVTSQATFVAESCDGIVSLDFTFDATRLNENDRLVVFEKLFFEEVELASHEDIDDAMQGLTIGVPEIATTAKSHNDTKEVVRDTKVTIKDTVEYKNLMPDQAYELNGIIMEKKSNAPLKDQEGKEVCASLEFTPEHTNGEVELEFTFDASMLETGDELVVFEKLLHRGKEITSHEDLEDKGQTVSIQPASIFTTAIDPADGDQWVNAREDAKILDTIFYEGLEPGGSYVFVGKLMDKQDKVPFVDTEGLPIEAQTKVVAEEQNGTCEVAFTFDASQIPVEKEIVVFEELYSNDLLIADHCDYENMSQTVIVSPPSISTHASDASDSDQEITKKGKASITDTVEYKGLETGRTYKLSGALMIDDGTLQGTPALDASGVPITAQTTFVAEASHGTAELTFDIDSSIYLEGTRMVVFEKIYHEQALLAIHEDIRDEAQTVTIGTPGSFVMGKKLTKANTKTPVSSSPRSKSSAVDTGDRSLLPFAICASLSMLALLGLIWLRYRIVPKERK